MAMANVYKGSKSAQSRVEQEEEHHPLLREVVSGPPAVHPPSKRDIQKEVEAEQDVNNTASDLSSEPGPPDSNKEASIVTATDADSCAAPTCRICFDTEEDPANPLISPCLCSGSSSYVHRECLQHWRTSAHRHDAYYQCEVCKFRYQYRRLWWAVILGSRVTIATGFVLLVSLLIFCLGFIPMMPAAIAARVSGVLPHIINGVIVIALIGLVLTVLGCILAACTETRGLFAPDLLGVCCLDCSQLGSVPLEAGAALGSECGMVLIGILLVLMLIAGFAMACYMLYGVLWLMVTTISQRAQEMVENVGGKAPVRPPIEEMYRKLPNRFSMLQPNQQHVSREQPVRESMV